MIYESRGYLVKHEGGAKPDKGIDLLVDSKEGPFVVQCKHWRKKDISVKGDSNHDGSGYWRYERKRFG